jgi:hypothetical protein
MTSKCSLFVIVLAGLLLRTADSWESLFLHHHKHTHVVGRRSAIGASCCKENILDQVTSDTTKFSSKLAARQHSLPDSRYGETTECGASLSRPINCLLRGIVVVSLLAANPWEEGHGRVPALAAPVESRSAAAQASSAPPSAVVTSKPADEKQKATPRKSSIVLPSPLVPNGGEKPHMSLLVIRATIYAAINSFFPSTVYFCPHPTAEQQRILPTSHLRLALTFRTQSPRSKQTSQGPAS